MALDLSVTGWLSALLDQPANSVLSTYEKKKSKEKRLPVPPAGNIHIQLFTTRPQILHCTHLHRHMRTQWCKQTSKAITLFTIFGSEMVLKYSNDSHAITVAGPILTCAF